MLPDLALTDLAPSLILSGAAVLVLPGLSRRSPLARAAVMAVMAASVLRYLAWRVTQTVPDFTTDPAALWMWLILVLEALTLVHLTLTALFLSRRSDRRSQADALEGALRSRRDLPGVDVLIPTYGEPVDVLERTIVGALALDWPGGVRVWVLDDSGRPWLAELCAAKGARWVTRLGRSGGKAGNLNAWLAATAGGGAPLVVVLDADFVPQRNFLWRTAGFLDDPAVGLVQTPQSFFNPDPIQMSLLSGGALADEQRFFYHEVQPCLDAWGASFCCGSSFLVRRACLDAIGGVPTDTVTEDMMTTYALDRRGWSTVWLDEPLSAGMAPEGLAEFLNQRSRWCLGTVQALTAADSPLRAPGIRLMSRVYFLAAQLYWLASFPLVLAASAAPAVFWWTGVPALDASAGEFAAHFGPRLVAEAAALWWVSRGAIVPVLSGVSALVAAPVVVASAWRALLSPRGHAFKVTAKGGTRDRVVVHGGMVAWLAGIMVATGGGIAISQIPELAVGLSPAATQINLALSALALVFLFLGVLVCIELPRRRASERFAVDCAATLWVDGVARPVRLEDLSLIGARVHLPDGPETGAASLDLAPVGVIAAQVVRRRSGRVLLRFEEGCRRDALIRFLYTGSLVLPAGTFRPGQALRSALRRGFASAD